MPEETLLTPPAADTGTSPAATGNEKPAVDATKPAEGSEADKPAEGEGASDKSKDGKADKAKDGAPEKYEFKLPEGVQLDEALVSEFTPLAKELNLNQEGAQKLVDLYTKVQTEANKKTAEYWTDLNKQWVEAASADKEYGGADFDKNVAVALKAVKTFGTPELTEALNLTGMGNHPELIRFFYKVGKAVSDDKFDTGSGKTDAAKDPAKLLFPNQN